MYFTYDGNNNENYTIFINDARGMRPFMEVFACEDVAIGLTDIFNKSLEVQDLVDDFT